MITNRATANAAEMLVGALHDNHRGRTYRNEDVWPRSDPLDAALVDGSGLIVAGRAVRDSQGNGDSSSRHPAGLSGRGERNGSREAKRPIRNMRWPSKSSPTSAEVSNFEQTEVPWLRTILCNPFTRLSVAHRKGCFNALCTMQVEQAGGIYFGDNDPFLRPQTSCQSRRLGIPKGLGLLGLRLFTVYHPGNRVASIRGRYRSVCGCLVVRWWSEVCVLKC